MAEVKCLFKKKGGGVTPEVATAGNNILIFQATVLRQHHVCFVLHCIFVQLLTWERHPCHLTGLVEECVTGTSLTLQKHFTHQHKQVLWGYKKRAGSLYVWNGRGNRETGGKRHVFAQGCRVGDQSFKVQPQTSRKRCGTFTSQVKSSQVNYNI